MAGVKLFGATIPVLQPVQEASVEKKDKELQHEDFCSDPKKKEQESPTSDENIDGDASSMPDDAQKTSTDEDSPSSKTSNSEEIQVAEKNNDQQEKQSPKKPDKILPCPRCNSLDTKFCYYNNYNVNQPRHFCKNCQRYWTAGGTMRNVPVGAGRRKNKSSTHHNNMVLHDIATLQTLQSNTILANSNSIQLSFGSDAPLCESMASVLNIAEKTMKNGICSGFQKPQELEIQLPPVENIEEPSSVSSITASNLTEEGERTNSNDPIVANCKGFPPAIPCYSGTPWPYPWTPTPPFCAPTFPIPFYPATAYWGGWSVPWIAPLISPPSNGSSVLSSSSSSVPNSPTLGKHSRDGTVLSHSSNNSSENGDAPKKINQEGGIWIPKTLRIDDPEEAAKSSIWASIGIKKEKTDCGSTSGLFKAFQTKEVKNCHSTSGASKVLHANPAAFSRSLSFQESS